MAGNIRESKTILTAEDKTAGAFASMQRNVDATVGRITGMQAAFAGLAGVVVGGAFAAMIKSSIDATARFKDLAQEAGTTASNLSKFEAPARMAGLGLDTVAAAMFKLSKAALEAKDPTSRAAQALGSIGISTQQLKNLKPDEMFELIAKQAAKYGDGLEKNAVMQELLGKSGREMNRVLKEVAEAGILHASVTNQQAEEADKLGDQLIELQMNSEKLWRSLLGEAVPAINDVGRAFIDARKEGGLLDGVFAAFGKAFEKMQGGPEEQLKRINKLIETQRENVAQDVKHQGLLNDYLAERARLEKKIFDIGLADQDKRALAGATGKGNPDFDPAARAAAEAARRKAEAEALKEAEKALRDYVKAAMDALAADEETAKQLAAIEDKRTAAILSTEKVIDQIQFETTLIGLNNDEREKAIALRTLENSGIDKSSAAFDQLKTRLVAALDQQKQVREQFDEMKQQTAMWDEMADRAGNFFSDLVMNGKSAFDRLRDSLKSFVAELLAAMAKRYILNIVTGTNAPVSGGSALINGVANSPLGLMAAVAAAGYGLGSAGAGALGAGERGQKVGGITGLLGGGLLGAIIGKFTDPNGLANRTADFGGGRSNYWWGGGQSAFGSFGITNDKWFSDADMLDKVKTFQTGLANAENALAKYLTTDQISKVTAALANSKNYSFGTEHGDFAGTLGQILKDRIDTIIAAVDPSLKKWLDSFTGTGDELAAYAESLLQVRQALNSDEVQGLLGRIPELTIDGLMKMKAAGESLSDTFQRVVGEFITAQNNLNAAIGARNPAFARDLVLGQRNSIGAQFGALIGQSYGAGLATQMATNPQSFTGLSTEGMSLLAQWLGLQTTLEQLDAQLSNTTTPAINDFTAAVVNSASAMSSAIGGLASYLRGSLLGDLSPLSPQARYAEAKKQFNDNLALAQGGNIDAISSFGSYRDAFLSASRAVNASSGQYNTDFFGSFNAGAALTGGAVRPYTAADANVNTSAIVAAIAATASGQQVTNTILVDYLNELAQGNTSQNSTKIVELLGMLNDRVRNNGGALTSGSGALA